MKTDSRTKLEKKSQEVVRKWAQLDKQLGIGNGATWSGLLALVPEWVGVGGGSHSSSNKLVLPTNDPYRYRTHTYYRPYAVGL